MFNECPKCLQHNPIVSVATDRRMINCIFCGAPLISVGELTENEEKDEG